jgi:hypothetical protein
MRKVRTKMVTRATTVEKIDRNTPRAGVVRRLALSRSRAWLRWRYSSRL